jgi:hypothetical protein
MTAERKLLLLRSTESCSGLWNLVPVDGILFRLIESCSGLSNLPPDLDAGAALADLADAVDAADLTLAGWKVLRLQENKSMACLTTGRGGGGGPGFGSISQEAWIRIRDPPLFP